MPPGAARWPVQPRPGAYGGQGLARPSQFLPLNQPRFLQAFVRLWEEHVEGFTQRRPPRSSRDDARTQLWRQRLHARPAAAENGALSDRVAATRR